MICFTLEFCTATTVHNGWISPSEDILSGDVVTVTCQSGYSLSGSSQISCIDGWFDHLPTCKGDVMKG